MTSDVGETTSTDSDIGTSPSGTTLASPPSSPQQPQLKQTKLIKLQPPPLPPPPTPPTQLNSVIRHHSYLNAVQLNDFKLNHQIKSNILIVSLYKLTKKKFFSIFKLVSSFNYIIIVLL